MNYPQFDNKGIVTSYSPLQNTMPWG